LEITNKSPGPLPSLLPPHARGTLLCSPAAGSAAPLAASSPPLQRHLLLRSFPRVASFLSRSISSPLVASRARATPSRAVRRLPRSHRRCQLLLAPVASPLVLTRAQHHCVILFTLVALLFHCLFPFPEIELSPDLRRPTVHRRQPLSLLLNPNSKLLEHRCDPLMLSNPCNFIFSHPNFIFHSSGRFELRRRLRFTVDSSLRALPLLSPSVTPIPTCILPIGSLYTFPMTCWFSCAGSQSTITAGASPSTVTPPPRHHNPLTSTTSSL
jgi:hypothetical protein